MITSREGCIASIGRKFICWQLNHSLKPSLRRYSDQFSICWIKYQETSYLPSVHQIYKENYLSSTHAYDHVFVSIAQQSMSPIFSYSAKANKIWLGSLFFTVLCQKWKPCSEQHSPFSKCVPPATSAEHEAP